MSADDMLVDIDDQNDNENRNADASQSILGAKVDRIEQRRQRKEFLADNVVNGRHFTDIQSANEYSIKVLVDHLNADKAGVQKAIDDMRSRLDVAAVIEKTRKAFERRLTKNDPYLLKALTCGTVKASYRAPMVSLSLATQQVICCDSCICFFRSHLTCTPLAFSIRTR